MDFYTHALTPQLLGNSEEKYKVAGKILHFYTDEK